jgi:hypothetical protein
MNGITYDQLYDIYHEADRLCRAWPDVTMIQLARLVWNLRKAIEGEGGNGRVITTNIPPEEMYAGTTCSISGG